MKELKQEQWLRLKKGKNVSVERKPGECHQWKATGQCSKGDGCSFCHDDSTRGEKTQSSSPVPRPQTHNDGRKPSKGKSPRGSSPTGRRNQKACRRYLTGNTAKKNRDANSSKSACSGTPRLTASPTKSRRKVVEKDRLPYGRIRSNWVAYHRTKSHRNPNRFLRKSTKSLGPKRSVQFSKGTIRHGKIGKIKGPSQGVTGQCEPHDRSPHAPKIEDRTHEETLQQERCSRRDVWEMAKNANMLKEKDKATFYSFSEVWSFKAPSSTKPEEK